MNANDISDTRYLNLTYDELINEAFYQRNDLAKAIVLKMKDDESVLDAVKDVEKKLESYKFYWEGYEFRNKESEHLASITTVMAFELYFYMEEAEWEKVNQDYILGCFNRDLHPHHQDIRLTKEYGKWCLKVGQGSYGETELSSQKSWGDLRVAKREARKLIQKRISEGKVDLEIY